MNRSVTVILLLVGLGCTRQRLKTALPPLDPRCSKENISASDIGYIHNFIAPIASAKMQSEYMKTEYYVGPSGSDADTYTPHDESRQWTSPDSAHCLRLAAARSPHCPGNESSLDCRNDWSWWAHFGPLLPAALKRIQSDQRSCRLSGVYDEFLTYPHTDEEKAAVCLGMMLLDPNMHPCLEKNKAALQELARTSQRSDRQTYATLLFNSSFTDRGLPLWDSDYDTAFAWIEKNLFPIINPKQDDYASQRYYRISAISAFRSRDRDSLMKTIARASISHGGKFSVGTELELLSRLELHGDEGKIMLTYGAKPWIDEMWSGVLRNKESMKTKSPPIYDPIRIKWCRFLD